MWAAGFSGSGGAGKEDDAVCCSALLAYGNGNWDLTTQSFRVGGGEGDPVLGLVSLPASVPEQAVLGVLKQNSIHLVRTDPTVPVANFQDSMVPESVAGGLGVVGKRAYTVYGNDLYYAAPDRSFRRLSRMQAAASQYEVLRAVGCCDCAQHSAGMEWAVAKVDGSLDGLDAELLGGDAVLWRASVDSRR